MTALEMLFAGYCLVTGIVMGWLWASAPLKRKVLALESDLARVKAKLESPRRKTKKA